MTPPPTRLRGGEFLADEGREEDGHPECDGDQSDDFAGEFDGRGFHGDLSEDLAPGDRFRGGEEFGDEGG